MTARILLDCDPGHDDAVALVVGLHTCGVQAIGAAEEHTHDARVPNTADRAAGDPDGQVVEPISVEVDHGQRCAEPIVGPPCVARDPSLVQSLGTCCEPVTSLGVRHMHGTGVAALPRPVAGGAECEVQQPIVVEVAGDHVRAERVTATGSTAETAALAQEAGPTGCRGPIRSGREEVNATGPVVPTDLLAR